MNYIRTKDRIYEVKEENVKFRDKLYYMAYERKTNGGESIISLIAIDKVVNSSDDPAELCDEFIYNDQEYDLPQRCHQSYRGEWYDEQRIRCLNNEEVLTIKGAIWTNKGLQFVAKMNSEENLELIWEE